MPKSPDAFRTISEVADWLGVQAHVLRFWESKFSQVKPIKRAGGRRYYRPADMLLLGGLKKILHEDGLTIKGAQKLLREKGVSFVAEQSQPLDDLTSAVIEGTSAEVEDISAPEDAEFVDAVETEEQVAASDAELNAPLDAEAEDALPDRDEVLDEPLLAQSGENDDVEEAVQASAETAEHAEETGTQPAAEEELAQTDGKDSQAGAEEAMPQFRARPRERTDREAAAPPHADDAAAQTAGTPETETTDADEPAIETILKPRIIDLPPLPAPEEIDVSPSALSALAGLRRLTAQEAREIKPLLARLTRLHASMARPRTDIGKD
ncbi:MAG: MerR family transcriptional regulator [Roseobacter sp.]|jgi:DNA-binding transcriptional MerR regulator